MSDLTSIDLPVDTTHRPAFVFNWEVTYFCNLDCSYCLTHDSIKRPSDKEKAFKSLDFAFQYIDLIMTVKRPYERIATLNLLGGEALTHPDIVEILAYASDLYNSIYRDRWKLTTTIVTNGIVGHRIIKKCLQYIDFWTVSYHTEVNPKQRTLRWKNILLLQEASKLSSVRLMAHSDSDKFQECLAVADKLKQLGIAHELKIIGSCVVHESKETFQWRDKKSIHAYNHDQAAHILHYWKLDPKALDNHVVKVDSDKYLMAAAGQTCCSEQDLCFNSDRKKLSKIIPRTEFKDWYCSVNWFFLFIKQHTGTIYHNTACRVNYDGSIGPLGYINDADQILSDLKDMLRRKELPVIKCTKCLCSCGRCAPKASEKEIFKKIINIHIDESFLKY